MSTTRQYNLMVALVAGLTPALFVWIYGLIAALYPTVTDVHRVSTDSALWLAAIPPLGLLFVEPRDRQTTRGILELLGWALLASAVFLIAVTIFDQLFGVKEYLTNWTTAGSEDGPFFALPPYGFTPIGQFMFLVLMSTEGLLLAAARWFSLQQAALTR